MLFSSGFFSVNYFCYSQRYLSDLDSSLLYLNDTVRPLLKRFENLQFSGYIQPQFQLADTEGAKSLSGGDLLLILEKPFHAKKSKSKT